MEAGCSAATLERPGRGTGAGTKEATATGMPPRTAPTLRGVDPRLASFGQYLQRMIETIQTQWERILIGSKLYPATGTQVKVVFRLDREGRIRQIVSVEGTAGTKAEQMGIVAITARAPYGRWTD